GGACLAQPLTMPKEPPKNRPGNKTWSYIAGTRGINRIRVYESEPGGVLYIEWHDRNGRNRESLGIYDKQLAAELAEHSAAKQLARRHADTKRELFGLPKEHTLAQLLDRLHADKGGDWSKSHAKGQERFRKFWLRAMGGQASLTDISPALVERAARAEASKRGWKARTQESYLRYIVDAFYYAQHRLKWITEPHNLSAVQFPRGEQESLAYTTDQLQAILEHAPDVDLRAAGVGWIAANTGRRLNAIRTLKASTLRQGDGHSVITFPGRTDKARKTGEAVLVGEAERVLGLLAQSRAVQATGLLFPSGDLSSEKPRARRPISREDLLDWWHDAERAAGVPVVKGRGYHGIKRWFATAMEDVGAAEKQSGTSRAMLLGRYRQDELAPKVALAETLDRKLRGA
ncbi:MAG TPA: hypothetical protein VK966_00965, partial [Longimicrobiales bacterium]|nr:hypothetical protein [Longimicrobiales bacterium]